MDCNEVLEQLKDYLDPEARVEMCRLIEEHLSRCSTCKVEVDTIKKTIMIYHSSGPSETPVRVIATLARAMDDEYRRSRPSISD